MMVAMEQSYITAGFFRHFMYKRHQEVAAAAAPLRGPSSKATGLKAKLGLKKAKMDSLGGPGADDNAVTPTSSTKHNSLSRRSPGSSVSGERCSN